MLVFLTVKIPLENGKIHVIFNYMDGILKTEEQTPKIQVFFM